MKQIIEIASENLIDLNKLKVVKKFGTVILNQMNMMESFVEDLLNLHQMQEGVFKLNMGIFNL